MGQNGMDLAKKCKSSAYLFPSLHVHGSPGLIPHHSLPFPGGLGGRSLSLLHAQVGLLEPGLPVPGPLLEPQGLSLGHGELRHGGHHLAGDFLDAGLEVVDLFVRKRE